MTAVVITGLGLVTPVGTGVEEFWKRLLNGESGIREISSFDVTDSPVRIAGEIGDFDARDWLKPAEARRMDRVAHLAIAASELAMRDNDLAGIDRTGVATIISSGIGGAGSIDRAVRAFLGGSKVSPFFIPTAMANAAGSAVAHRFGFGGPSHAPVTACASSADAIGQGFRLVRDGYATACIAGGAEACLNPVIVSGFAGLRALSRRNHDPAGACRPFDADRDGFVLGEGAAVVVLETAESARRRGVRGYAEVCGYGQTNDSYHLTAPRPDGAAASRAILAALSEAGARPEEVGYINAHGTGTRLSDASETAAVKQAFGQHSRKLAISSTKSMTGHLLGGTGALEAAVCALALDRGWIPPTINLTAADPECDLDYVPNTARRMELDVTMSNSFAFGGHNVSLVLRRTAAATREG